MQVYELRPSREADYEAIAKVWHSSASLPGVGPAIMPTETELRKRVDLEFAAGWSVTVAVRSNEVVGFVAIKKSEAVLAELFVRPGSIGGGIGQALLAHAIAAMPEGFTLHTRSANAKARRFYERAGLVVLRDDTHPRTGDPVTYYGWHVR
jgi:ribosomal protein S18 acetylase RimI-like enzyme